MAVDECDVVTGWTELAETKKQHKKQRNHKFPLLINTYTLWAIKTWQSVTQANLNRFLYSSNCE